MTRLTRMLLPTSLSVLLTSAIILACTHHGAPGEAPATPRPSSVAPSDHGAPGERDGSGASLTPAPPSSDRPPSRAAGATLEVQLASQPGVPEPGVPGPGSPTTPGSPTRPGAPNAPIDAGDSDAYSPPLPPVPDARVPGDSRMEPILGGGPDARLR